MPMTTYNYIMEVSQIPVFCVPNCVAAVRRFDNGWMRVNDMPQVLTEAM